MPLKVFRRQSAAEKKQKRKDLDGKKNVEVGVEEKAKPEAPRPRRASEARQVVPSSQELNEAIADVLRNDENALPKAIREDLLRAHPSWKLPERRVSKFVKRQKRFCGGPTKVTSPSPSPSPNDEAGAGDDDDEASTLVGEWSQKAKGLVRGAGKTVRGAGSSIRNLFRNKSTNQLHRDGATTGTLETKELPDTIDVATTTGVPHGGEQTLADENVAQQENKNSMGAEEKPETAPADADVATAGGNGNIYQDDGTDREEKRGLCTPCEGAQCIIM